MSEEQITEIHNRVIKGLTYRVMVLSAIFIVPVIYQVSIFIHNQGLQGAQITKISSQIDTIQQRQSRYEFNNAIKFQGINDKVQEVSGKVDNFKANKK